MNRHQEKEQASEEEKDVSNSGGRGKMTRNNVSVKELVCYAVIY